MTNLPTAPQRQLLRSKGMVSAIISRDPIGVIGRDDDIPWFYQDEFNWYNAVLRTYDYVVMGYNTAKTTHHITKDIIILDRNGKSAFSSLKTGRDQNIIRVNNIEFILKVAELKSLLVVGGAKTFNTFLPHTELIHMAEIKHRHNGNKFFMNKLEQFTSVQRVVGDDFTYDRLVRLDG